MRILILAVWCLLLCASCQTDSGQIIKIVIEDATPEEQGTIGLELSRVLNAELPVRPRPQEGTDPVYDYLDAVLRPLALNPATDRRRLYDWRVWIIEDDTETSAFTLPGGQIYLYTGLLRSLRDESELAAVLAHEITYADTDFMLLALLGNNDIGGERLGDILIGNPVEDATQIAEAIPELTMIASYVLTADEQAVRRICPMNYRSEALRKVLARTPEEPLDWLSTRTTILETRLSHMDDLLETCPAGGIRNVEAYRSFLNRL